MVKPVSSWSRCRPTTAFDHRVYAIGDIHGRLDLFGQLLRMIERDSASRADRRHNLLVVLGDFIDRGPQSRRIVELLMAAQQQTARLLVLLGNHEAALLDAIAGDGEAQAGWLRFGGLATLASFDIDPPRSGETPATFGERLARGLSRPVVDWLSGLPLTTTSGDYFFCHAGVRPDTPLSLQHRDDLLWMRDPFLSSDRDFGAVVVHGHTVVDAVEIRENRINVDTGAYRTGILSAACLDARDVRILATQPELELVDAL